MTRIFLTTLFALCCLTGAEAQPSAGTFSLVPRVGVSIANMSGSDLTLVGYESTELHLGSRSKAGFVAGAEGRYQATDLLAVSLGAYYASLGYRHKDCELCVERTATTADYDVYTGNSTTLDYVMLPVMAHVFVARGLAVEAGIQPAFMTHASTQYDTYRYQIDTESGQRTESGTVQTMKQSGTEGYHKFDVAIPVGISYEYARVVLNARYHLGLGRVDRLTGGKNRYFTFSVGYRI